MELRDIKDYVKKYKLALKYHIEDNLAENPKLAIIQVGENEASTRYVRNKVKDCKEVGIKFNQVFDFIN